MFHPEWLHSIQKSKILSVSLVIFPQISGYLLSSRNLLSAQERGKVPQGMSTRGD